MKKLLIALVILIVVGLGFLPVYMTRLAKNAFAKPDAPSTQDDLRNAVRFKMCMYMFMEARETAERAIIWFPESPHIDSFLYSAALCAERENLPDVAIYWYSRFVKIFPEHPWSRQVQSRLEKLKAINDAT